MNAQRKTNQGGLFSWWGPIAEIIDTNKFGYFVALGFVWFLYQQLQQVNTKVDTCNQELINAYKQSAKETQVLILESKRMMEHTNAHLDDIVDEVRRMQKKSNQ